MLSPIPFIKALQSRRRIETDENRRFLRHHVKRRLDEINAALPKDGSDYTLLCGDSHIECLPIPVGSRRAINAGITGSDAQTYLEAVTSFQSRHSAVDAVLMVGSNDIVGRRKNAIELSSFRAAVAEIIDRLSQHADRVLVSAIPPIPRGREGPRTAWAVQQFSEALADLSVCKKVTFFDPFYFVRGIEFGIADPKLFYDNVHFANYQWVHDEIMFSLTQNDHHW